MGRKTAAKWKHQYPFELLGEGKKKYLFKFQDGGEFTPIKLWKMGSPELIVILTSITQTSLSVACCRASAQIYVPHLSGFVIWCWNPNKKLKTWNNSFTGSNGAGLVMIMDWMTKQDFLNNFTSVFVSKLRGGKKPTQHMVTCTQRWKLMAWLLL